MQANRIRPILALTLAALLVSAAASAQSGPLWITGGAGTQLATVDPATGTVTVIGSTGHPGAASLALHPDGTLYTFIHSMTSDPNIPEQLAIFNLDTGQATPVGSPLPERARIMPTVVGPDGTLYAAGVFGDGNLANRLLIIDRYTGQPTEVGPFGVSGIMDFAFDDDGTLYGCTQTMLYRIDTATGAATAVAEFSGDIVLSDKSRRIMGIHIAPNGTLFATDFVPPSVGTSSLYQVNRTTGVGTRLANLGLVQVHSADMKPPTPAARVNSLAARTESYNLGPGIAQSLLAKLRATAATLDRGQTAAACGILGAFREDVLAIAHYWLTAAQAGQLALDALWTQTSINCGG